MKLVLDSSVLISHFGLKDSHTPITKWFFSNLPKNLQIVLPALVIAETLTILSKQKFKKVRQVYETLISFKVIPLDNVFLEQLKSVVLKGTTKLKTSDLIIALTAKFNQAVLISWDERLLTKENHLCPTLTPQKFLDQIGAKAQFTT